MRAPQPRFSRRTLWDLAPNALAERLAQRRKAGREVLDLTESNPTRCGFDYDQETIRRALSDGRSFEYAPDPRGLVQAREAVSRYYAGFGAQVPASHVLLTCGSSEAYSHLFHLLADPGDNILVPQPSYPLLEFLSRLSDVKTVDYRLDADHNWQIDFASLEAAHNRRSRAVVVVSPNNPTGSLVSCEERARLAGFCAEKRLALIADEVFLDYTLGAPGTSLAVENRVPAFAMGGLSKAAALPQMKLGWIAVNGPCGVVEEALGRLEVIADAYLSVGTPVQLALPLLLAQRSGIQEQMRRRILANLQRLDELLALHVLCSRLPVEGGWSAILRVPKLMPDEEWAVTLLDEDGVLVYPGHFFNFSREGHLVLSLLPQERVFGEAVESLLRRIQEAGSKTT